MIDVEHISRLGDAMKDLRWAARLTQTEVRDRTGMSAPQLSRYENGHETPSLESLVKYLAAVSADLCDLQRVLVEGVKTDARPAAVEGRGLAAVEGRGPAAVEGRGLAAVEGRGLAAVEGRGLAAVEGRGLTAVRAEADRRLESSPDLRRLVRDLMRPNADGLERLERRLVELEEKLERESA